MLRFIYKSLAFVILIAALASCKSKNEIARMVPADAIAAAFFDAGSMLQKLPYEQVKSLQIFRDAADSALPAIKEILNNPEEAGINISKGLTAFIIRDTSGNFRIVLGGVLDHFGKFETLTRKLNPGQEVKQAGDISTLKTSKGGAAGWDKQRFYFITPSTDLPGDIEETAATAAFDGHRELTALFKMSDNQSLVSDKRFEALLSQPGDLKIWVNSERLASVSTFDAISMFKMDAFIKDSRSTYAIEFNEGQINVAQKLYYGKELTDLLTRHKSGKVKAQEFAAIPSDDIAAALSLDLDPNLIADLLKLIGVDGLANMALGMTGGSLDDLIKGLNGKFLLSITDLHIHDIMESSSESGVPEDFNLLFRAGVRSKPNLQKIAEGALRTTGVADDEVPLVMNDDFFTFSNTREFALRAADNQPKATPEWAAKISGHPVALFADVKKILERLPRANDSAADRSIELNRRFWDRVYAFGGEAEKNGTSFSTEFHLQDKKTNSLKQISSLLDQLYLFNKEKIRQLKLQNTDGAPDESDSEPTN